ncbi:MAG: hypothetical protein FJY85_14150 [Deltaproteobacteria bacterium]|nr:hypothetical protein [Deltaproteobacteria bacterium]
MRKRTWKATKGHHIVPKQTWTAPIHEVLYDDLTVPLSGEEHVQMHRDIKEVGVPGSLARYDVRRWTKRRKS